MLAEFDARCNDCSGKGGVPRCVIETRVITVIILWKMGKEKCCVVEIFLPTCEFIIFQ